MAARGDAALRALPSVDRVLAAPQAAALIERMGREPMLEAVRAAIAEARAALRESGPAGDMLAAIVQRAAAMLERQEQPSLRRVFNLTGTVLHTNLGRAVLPREAIAAIAAAAGAAANLEYDLETGARGERDAHVRARIIALTGAEAATVVNNNAAAVFLVLNTLALGKEVLISRGELVEIGGSFRVPDIMARSGVRMVEVGTTNRTHARDFANAIGPDTALVMKVHTSNYAIQGFTAAVPERELAAIAHGANVSFVNDLGSGTLIDLERFGLPHEPTPRDALAEGADLVTFSGDKLLGGPQCGIIVGRKDLIARLDQNPMKRAMRLDKLRLAALEAVLRHYADPDRLAERLPTLRQLTRPKAEIAALAARLAPRVATALAGRADVAMADCASQIGSGALPVDLLPSAALVLRARESGGAAIERLAAAFRRLPVPVIGRIHDGALWLDLRCLDAADEDEFAAQLAQLPA